MALARYVITSAVTVPAGTPVTPTAGEPDSGGAAGYGNTATTGGALYPQAFTAGTVMVLDPAGPLYVAIGSANLRPYADTDAVGHAALSWRASSPMTGGCMTTRRTSALRAWMTLA